MYKNVISEDETSVSSSLSEQTSYQTVMFLMPLILDEFQSECDLTRDVQLARQAIEQGVLESVNADLRYTVMVTQVMEEEDSTIADETCAATIKHVANKYLNAHAFCLNEKMITFLWGDKSTFEKQLHLAAEEICQSFTCGMMRQCLVGVGSLEVGLSGLHKAYVEATKAINYAKEKKTKVSFIEDIKQHKNTATLITEQALEIIEKHYMDPELSLVSISNKIAVSPNYLSASFKKVAGCTFIDLLSQKRIHVAQECLVNSNMKIREIAEQCGYRDQHYFSYCFKKYTGMSPNECRKKALEAL